MNAQELPQELSEGMAAQIYQLGRRSGLIAAEARYWAGYAEGLEDGTAVGTEGIVAAGRAVGWLPPTPVASARRLAASRPHPHLLLLQGGAA